MSKAKNIQDKFNFFMPGTFEKSEATGEMKISGVCSSATIDSDGEVLEPAGFDFQPLLEKGFYNWNHQAKKSASAIIGRPTKAMVINGGQDFYTEGFLYKGLEEAVGVFNLAKVLEIEDTERSLGFSIEGRAVERDAINPKRIIKAVITGIAITHCPKNANTLLSIMKGEYAESFIEEEEDEIEPADMEKAKDYRELTRGVIARQTGREPKDITDEELDKAMSVEANQHLVKESVEGKPKEMEQYLTKSDVYKQIFNEYGEDLEKAKQVYNLAKKIQEMKNKDAKEGISQDTIDKAFQILDLSKSETSKSHDEKKEGDYDKKDDLMKNEGMYKGKDGKMYKNEAEYKDKMEKMGDHKDYMKKSDEELETLVKGFMEEGLTKGAMVDNLIKGGMSYEAASTTVGRLCQQYSSNKDGGTITVSKVGKSEDGEDGKEKIEKSEEEKKEDKKDTVEKSESEKKEDTVEKSEVAGGYDFEKAFGSIEKSFGSVETKFGALGEILKAQNEDNIALNTKVESLTEKLEKAEGDIKTIGDQPNQRKSLKDSKHVERFDKSEAENNGFTVLSMSSREDRARLGDHIMGHIEKSRIDGKPYDMLEKAIQSIEMAKSVPAEVLPFLEANKIKVSN